MDDKELFEKQYREVYSKLIDLRNKNAEMIQVIQEEIDYLRLVVYDKEKYLKLKQEDLENG